MNFILGYNLPILIKVILTEYSGIKSSPPCFEKQSGELLAWGGIVESDAIADMKYNQESL